MTKKWDPATHPYYLLIYRRTASEALNYRDCVTPDFATYAEAEAAFVAPQPRYVTKIVLLEYRNGKHIEIATKKGIEITRLPQTSA